MDRHPAGAFAPAPGDRRPSPGIVALREITRAASRLAHPMLTVYGFSSENWKRDRPKSRCCSTVRVLR